MLPLQARVDLGAMAMKGYSVIPKSPASDCLVSQIGHSLDGVLPLHKGAVGVFYSPSRLGNLYWCVCVIPVFLMIDTLSKHLCKLQRLALGQM